MFYMGQILIEAMSELRYDTYILNSAFTMANESIGHFPAA